MNQSIEHLYKILKSGISDEEHGIRRTYSMKPKNNEILLINVEEHHMDDFHESWNRWSAFLNKPLVDKALSKMINEGKSEVADISTIHSHIWGRDDNGEFDENREYQETKIRVSFKMHDDKFQWTIIK